MSADRHHDHPECGEGLDSDGEFALARAFIMSGDYAHAVKHLAFGLDIDPVDPEGFAIVDTLTTMLGPHADTLVAWEEPIWVGNVAVQSLILHALGRDEDAVGLLLQVIVADPSKRRSAWLRSWAADPALPLTPLALTRTMFELIRLEEPLANDDPRIPTLVDLTEVAAVVAKQPTVPTMLLTMASMVARRARLHDQALDFATEAFKREPSAEHLCLVGYARRERGELQLGLDAFVQASSIDPGSVAARLDAAETLAAMGRFLDAAEWSASVLGLDPDHPSAATRASYYRQRATNE